MVVFSIFIINITTCPQGRDPSHVLICNTNLQHSLTLYYKHMYCAKHALYNRKRLLYTNLSGQPQALSFCTLQLPVLQAL